jgi:serine/threonine-protein kinase
MDQLDSLRAALASRYDVDREIGRGGMARVYLAYDRQHGREVAIKVLSTDVAMAIGPDRFLREIRIAAGLQHPHILPLHDSGSASGLLYYIMPYVEGQTLRERMQRETQLPLGDALRIAREVADALSYAHEHGVVHRDIKPGNILLAGYPGRSGSRGGWHAVVADFGIARALGTVGDEPLTMSGMAVGTPEYMSPEQASGDPGLDGRTDVYALGCVLYEMLAGEPPFSSRTVQGTLARHRQDPVPPLHIVRPSVPAHVEAAVGQALAKVPADRFATAAEFADALEPAHEAPPAPISLPTPSSRPARGRRTVAALGLALVIGAAMLVGHLVRGRGQASMPNPALILVADFAGPPADRTLATAVRELVTAELDQSRVIAVLPRQQITAAMRDAGLADSARLTDALARELAVRSSVRTILSGSVLPVAAGRYSIVLRVADADSGRTLLTVTGAATDRDLIPAVQTAAREVRQGLGERQDAIAANQPLVQVATPSFAAYRKYVEAVALSERGEIVASNRLLQDALALDTGFASAWATTASNYQTMRNLDSAGLALAEALRRPARLSDAQRYRLQADAAYALRYDIPAAVRWYDLLLQIAPRHVSGHNNRAVLLYALGRYDEALAGFSRTQELEPFGTGQAQIEIFNQTVTLLALGRDADAATTARKLSGLFADYAAELLAAYRARWSVAESLSANLAADPSTPSWVRIPAVTLRAGAHAARGAVAMADYQLRTAAGAADEASRPWFCNAVLLLAAASARGPGPPPSWLLADTTSGGLLAGGLWAAMAGDTTTSSTRLALLQRRPAVQLRRLGQGPALVRAYGLAARGRWSEVTRELGPVAAAGELDGGDLNQVSSMALRWLMADAYARTGRADSAAAMYELVLDPTRTPFSHLALRGLVHSFASRRLALLYEGMGRPEAAAPHWKAFRSAFVTPDRELRALLAEAR